MNISATEYDSGRLAESFVNFYAIITRLRDPESGCPWDIKQTVKTIRENLKEEAYEVVSAINDNDDAHLREELGDLLLVIAMMVRIKEQENAFEFAGVLDDISAKLVRRHPHVFGTADADSKTDTSSIKTADDVVVAWDRIKTEVEGRKNSHSILEKIPVSIPELEKAYEIQKTVSKVGFDWKETGPVWEKLAEETGELKRAVENGNIDECEEELGDILFTIVNIGRLLKIHPANALQRTNDKFMKRFTELENRLKEKNIPVKDAGLELMDRIWDEIKAQEK